MLGGINNGLYLISLSGFLIVGVMALILKWAFSSNKSVVERDKKIGNDDEYGLLKVAASPKNHIEGEMLRQKLLSASSSPPPGCPRPPPSSSPGCKSGPSPQC